jgi:hypothetical protein
MKYEPMKDYGKTCFARIITMVKNWPNDWNTNCKLNSILKQYLKMEKFLAEEMV